MYAVSADFHAAILAGAKQKALLKFADTIFTNSDIAMQGGLALTEPFNAAEELTIGLCPSAFLTASLLNESGQLDTFTFGQFTAYLGVMTDSDTFTPEDGANASLMIGADIYSVNDTEPYVRKNGDALASQPPFAPKTIIVLDSVIYVISSAGAYYRYVVGLTHADMAAYTHEELAAYTHEELNSALFCSAYAADDVMVHKGIEWAANNAAIVFEDAAITEYSTDGTYEVYEMCPLGVFNVERPATVRKMVVKFTAYDNMSLTDVDITDWFAALTYPKTLGAIYSGLCTELGIATTTTTFINSTHSYTEAPFVTNSLTGRILLKYIAEAACSIARCDRAGNLLLDWFAAETHEITSLIGITPAEYAVAQIDKLQVQVETTDVGVIVGTGTNAYVLLANSLIVGDDEADITSFATPISTRLFAFPSYIPVSAKMVGDWSLQSGDIIDITYETVTYSVPIFTQTITWNGSCRVTLNSTGKPLRDVNTVTNRTEFLTKQKSTLIQQTIDGILITASKIVSFAQDAIPTSVNIGDLWVDTNDNNKMYRAASVGATTIAAGQWVYHSIASGYVQTSTIAIDSDSIDISSGGTLNLESAANLDVKSGANLNVKSGGDIEIEGGGDINIASTGKLNIASGGEMNIASGGKMTITTPTTLNITAGSGASAIGIKNDTYFLYAGNATPASAPFSVTMDGVLKALTGTFGGTLSAADGTFASLVLDDPSETYYKINLGEFSLTVEGSPVTLSGMTWGATASAVDYIGTSAGGGLVMRGSNGIDIDCPTGQTIDFSVGFGGAQMYLNNYRMDLTGDFDIFGDINLTGVLYDDTPSYTGDALADLSTVRADEKGSLDHNSLPQAARRKGKINNKGVVAEKDGRDLGMMISILTKAVQQLTEIVNKQQEQIDKLKGKQ